MGSKGLTVAVVMAVAVAGTAGGWATGSGDPESERDASATSSRVRTAAIQPELLGGDGRSDALGRPLDRLAITQDRAPPPRIGRLLVREDGQFVVEGYGPAGAEVRLINNNRRIASVRVGADSTWRASPAKPLGAGDHRLLVEINRASPDWLELGDEVRISIPGFMRVPVDVTFEADESLRRHAESVGDAASRFFDDLLKRKVIPQKQVARAEAGRGEAPAGPAAQVLDTTKVWLGASHSVYHSEIVPRLRHGGGLVLPQARPAGINATQIAMALQWPTVDGVTQLLQTWFGRSADNYDSEILPRLSGARPAGIVLTEPVDREDKDAAEAKRRAEEERRSAEARRQAELERRRAEAARQRAEEEARRAEAERQAEVERLREARQREENELRAAREREVAERRAAEARRQAEDDALERAERERRLAEEARQRAEEERRAAEIARLDSERTAREAEEQRKRQQAAQQALIQRERARTVREAARQAREDARRVEAKRLRERQREAEEQEQKEKARLAEIWQRARRAASAAIQRLRQRRSRDQQGAQDQQERQVARAPTPAAKVEPPTRNRWSRVAETPESREAGQSSRRRVAAADRSNRVTKRRKKAKRRVASYRSRRRGRQVRSYRRRASSRCRWRSRWRVRVPGKYVVRRGDSLWRIARRHYRRGHEYWRIYKANRRKIRNPNLIYPCQRFYIPRRKSRRRR